MRRLKPVFKLAAAAAIAAPLMFASAAHADDNAPAASLLDQNGPQAATMIDAPRADTAIRPSVIELAQAENSTAASAPDSKPEVAASSSSLGGVDFVSPWVLLGLGSLPLLWWLMRLNPPKPRTIPFPAIRQLLELESKEDQPASIPPWLRALRYTAAAMVIVGLAHPLLNPDEPLEGDGPLVLVVDNGWASAPNWSARSTAMNSLIDRAEREGRDVIVLGTAAPEDGGPITLVTGAQDARRFTAGLESQPWPADRRKALEALETLSVEEAASVVWLSNGLNDEAAADLARRLQELGSLTVFEDDADNAPYLLSLPSRSGDNLSVTVRRPAPAGAETLTLVARAEDSRAVEKVELEIEEGQTQVQATFVLPVEIRNQLTSIELEGESSAGAVVLLDERYRLRPVGLLDFGEADSDQPLLSEYNYIEQALDPYVDLRHGGVERLLERELAVMVLTGSTALSEADYDRVDEWVHQGGTLLRFAGASMADSEDELLPVELRRGGRTIGGTMSWSEPARIAPFDESSPFYGLNLPADVIIEKQVLAEPTVDLRERTWARLEDGTPLVTAEKRGEGWIVLVHTTANTQWSNLPLSGLFVDMLRTVVAQSQGVSGASEATQPLRPWMTLDGQGDLGDPSAAASALTREVIEEGVITPRNPPGFYGDDSVKRAYNMAETKASFEPLSGLPEGAERRTYEVGKEMSLMGPLLAGAFLLAMLDQLVVMRRSRRRETGAGAPKAKVAPG